MLLCFRKGLAWLTYRIMQSLLYKTLQPFSKMYVFVAIFNANRDCHHCTVLQDDLALVISLAESQRAVLVLAEKA